MPGDILAGLDRLTFYLEGVILVLLPLELLWLLVRRRLTLQRIKEMLASASPILPQILLAGTVFTALWPLFALAGAWRPLPVETNVVTTGLCLLLVDFLYYWEHRAGHRVRGLWALYHSVHHSSPCYDQTTALRVSIIDTAITPLFYLPAVLAGFDPWLVLLAFGFVVAYQTWIHTEAVGKLGFLDALFNTPSNHRVHHATQRQYLDRNYGGVLIIWDRLFGTYAAEDERPIYGLTTPIASISPFQVHFYEIVGFLRDWRRLGFRAGWPLFWHRPGWQPHP